MKSAKAHTNSKKAPTPSVRKKVLVIGSTGHAGVTCVDWPLLRNVPNIADFQLVVLNTCTLSGLIERLKAESDSGDEKRAEAAKKLGSLVSNNLALLKSKLIQVLRAGGTVYAILPEYGALWRPATYYSPLVSSDEWIPLPVQVRREPTDTLSLRSKEFRRYFAHVSSCTHVFTGRYKRDDLKVVIEDDLEPKPLVQLVSDNVATDWRGNAVACALAFTLRRAVPDRPPGHGEYEQDPYLSSGLLVLLPPPTEVSDDEAVRVLLEDFCGVAARSVPPDWVQAVQLPGDADRKAALADATKALEEAERKRDEAFQARAAAGEFKRLLYEKDLPLQDVVRKTFETIGIGTEDSPVSDEFMLVWEGEKVLVEVTGTKKSIAGRDLSQLIKDLGNYLHDVGQDVKGVLIGNALAHLPPDKRDTRDKPIFPDDVQQTGKKHSVALVSTLELFKAYLAFLESKVTPGQVFRRIADGSGIVTLVD